MSDILAKICATRRGEVAAAKAARPLDEIKARLVDAPPVRDFVASLRAASGMGLIAEVKKASPSAGLIRADFDPVNIALTYEQSGARCISCLTDETHFQGHLDYLTAIRQHVQIPVLRKDFILDPYQVYEARAAGADCILLIAECLDDCHLRELYFLAGELGMESLIELYEPGNMDRVLKLDAPLVGVNNRDLKTMTTDIEHSLELSRQVPESTLFVSESGIRTHADIQRLLDAGIRAVLVGESLMRQPNIGAAVRELLGEG